MTVKELLNSTLLKGKIKVYDPNIKMFMRIDRAKEREVNYTREMGGWGAKEINTIIYLKKGWYK